MTCSGQGKPPGYLFWGSEFLSFLCMDSNPDFKKLPAKNIWDRVATRYHKRGNREVTRGRFHQLKSDTQRIFMPVNWRYDHAVETSGVHWALVLVDLQAKQLVYYDSLEVSMPFTFCFIVIML